MNYVERLQSKQNWWFRKLDTIECNEMDIYSHITGHRMYKWRKRVCKIGIHHWHTDYKRPYCTYCGKGL